MEKDNYIKEKDLDSHPNPITVAKLKTILEQTEKSICDIKCSIEGHGTGFFCKVLYPDFFNLKPALITNNHVLGKEDIGEGKIIKFILTTLNNEKIHKEILITNKRKIFTNEKLDVTIIELNLQEDSIEPDSFLEIDSKINCENPNKEFKNIDVYIIGNIQDYTYGKIKNIDESGINIEHLCSTRPGMSGSPIINLNNFKVIGIHKGAHPKKQCNLGTFLKEPFKLFYKLNNTNLETITIKEENNNIKNVMNINNYKEKDKLIIKNLCPIIGIRFSGKTTFLNVLFNIDYLFVSPEVGTMFVNIIRYNPNVGNSPKFYHLKVKNKGFGNFDFYKEENTTIIGKENIKNKISELNMELRVKQVAYEELFYILEIGESNFIEDKEFLKN